MGGGAQLGMTAAKGAMQAIGGGPSSAESGAGDVSQGGDTYNFAPPQRAGKTTADAVKQLAPWVVVGVVAWLVMRK